MNRYSRKSKSDFLAALLTSILQTLLAGWSFMLAVGIVHHEWIPQCPTIGYLWALALAAFLRSALFFSDANRGADR